MENQYFTPPPVPEQKAERMEEIPPLKPNNWLWQSIVVTLFCCVPFGIVGIVYAAKVDVLYFNGRYQDAEASSPFGQDVGSRGSCHRHRGSHRLDQPFKYR